ncbi:MAG TPA: PAS domain S-box protein [Thermoanaerobaculia bacterium]|nr:PAS domain S-box protein [Thermoanaerobaculia bacterium]
MGCARCGLRVMADVFRRIVEEAHDFSIILLDREGRIELWNEGAEKIFGYAPGEVLGREFDLIFVPDDRARGVPAAEIERARRDGRADDTRWHLHKSGRWIFMDGVTMPVRDDASNITGFSKFARDITERMHTERRLAAQLALTRILSLERPFAESAREVMRAVCENLGWDIGMLWEVNDDHIECVDHWSAPHLDTAAAEALCAVASVEKGVGLPGQVWKTGAAVWVPQFRDAEKYPRAPLAEAAGMSGAFAFPITAAGKVIGALEFFSVDEREPDQALMPIMTLIGAQIGDFIERRRTAERLRESEQRYRLVSDTAQDAIFTIDEASTITFCNPAVERLFGYKPEELIGRKLDAIIPERLREAHRRGIARYLRTRERHIPWTGVELPAVHKDGHEFPCELSFGEFHRDGTTLFTGFARDVTERKRVLEIEQQARADAEATKQQLERRAEEEASFRHLASALTGAVEMTEVLYEITNRATLVTRADGVYVERIVQHGSQKLVEVVSSAGRGVPTRGLRVSFPGSMTDEILRGASPVILTEMSGFGRNMAPYLADTCANCEVLVTPLVAEQEPLGALVLLNSRASGRHFRDTDIVRARTLGDLASLALRRVRLMEQEREAKEKAEAAVRVRDETLGIVSHDLRNPLTTIVLSADLLQGAPPEEQPELVETIRTTARRMQRLIQDLLDVARVEAGGLAVAPAMMEIEPMVREVVAAHEPLAEQKKQRLSCDVRADLPRVCADRDRVVQVLGNLLGNALKFTPERGAVQVDVRRRDGDVHFSVRDSGPGIPEADLKSVFTPYWQAKKTAHMGAGLGLAIVRGIVEAHGGKVWAENAPGGGAMFTFTIPAST